MDINEVKTSNTHMVVLCPQLCIHKVHLWDLHLVSESSEEKQTL